MLDLHAHTTYSDGTLTPKELVQAAAAAGVRALAITDHDSLNGWDEAIAAAQDYNVEIVPGIELSTVYNERSLHILGFYPNRNKLQEPLRELQQKRLIRAQEMINKLAELGYPIKLPELGNHMAPGRPHIATALLKAGYVQSTREAFERWLHDDGPAYVHYHKFSFSEGISLLRACGAVPVWAHPYLFRGGAVEEVLKQLVEAGLMGVEVYHPSHTPTEIQNLEKLCAYYGLLITGGSDYHGPSEDGTVLNMLHLSLSFLEPLKQAAHSLK